MINFCLVLIEPSAKEVFIVLDFGRQRRVGGARVGREEENMAQT